jgi:general secretion pathway protein H
MLERKPQVQLPVGPAESGGQAGFTLIETVCVLAIFAMLAAVALPAFLKGTTRSRLEGYALQAATLLNADHDAAQRNGRDVTTEVDAPARIIRSGASGHALELPSDVTVRASLASRCENRAAGATIRYLASGLSCGGVISLTRLGSGYQIRVYWLTGVAEIVPIY